MTINMERGVPRLFIVSDTHFSHRNIITYCNRPFDDVEAMNEALIARWNAVVSEYDTVLHLGDVGFNYGSLFKIVSRLNGLKMLVRGNHDWNKQRMEALGFHCVTTYKNEVYTEPYAGRFLICAHRPRDLPTWDVDKIDTYGNKHVVLCGHEHNNAPVFLRWVRDKKDTARAIMGMNMSCEHWGYAPTPIDDVVTAYDRHLRPYLDRLKKKKQSR